MHLAAVYWFDHVLLADAAFTFMSAGPINPVDSLAELAVGGLAVIRLYLCQAFAVLSAELGNSENRFHNHISILPNF